MGTDQELHRTSNRVILLAVVLYMIAALVYASLTAYNMTGLTGQLMDLEFHLAGWGSVKLTVVLATVIYCLPLIPLVVLFRKLAPDAASSFKAYAASMSGSGGFPNPMTWRFVFGVTAVMLIAGALICATLFLLDEQKEGMPVYQVNLNSVPAELNSKNGFIELMGQAAQRYTEAYQLGSSLEVFAPIVEQGWTPASPVHYIVHYETTAIDSAPDLPFAFTNKAPSLFTGELSRRIPVPVLRKLGDAGLKIATGCALVDWQDLPDHHGTASYSDFFVASAIAVLVAFFTFAMLSFAKFQNARVLAARSR